MRCDRIWRNARLATMAPLGLGVVEDGVVACTDGRIVFAGKAADVPSGFDGDDIINCEGRWITPGLIDCHTHLIYGGSRSHEFELRLGGASYEEIARANGGIIATVMATRDATIEELVRSSLPRLDTLIAEGVTTIEVKSGYGLSLDAERKLLEAARALGTRRNVSVTTTFLGAHALPPEFSGDADGYIRTICETMIPALAGAGLCDAVDAYCEAIGFSPAQTRRVFEAARRARLPLKLHADQLSNQHGAALAAEFGALSADHLEYADEDGIAAMSKAGTLAVLLPGAFYFLRENRRPPVDLLRKHGVGIALATDCNPGTSPLTSLLLAMNMAAIEFGLTVEECLVGVTREAANALGRGAAVGILEPGKSCDLAIWEIERPAELVYRMGFNPLHARVWRGR